MRANIVVMNGNQSDASKLTDEQNEQNILDLLVKQHKLDDGLDSDTRAGALVLAKCLMVSRRKRYERKYQRQSELQGIRSSLWQLRNYYEGEHAGFRNLLNSLESSIDGDFDSMEKGYIDR